MIGCSEGGHLHTEAAVSLVLSQERRSSCASDRRSFRCRESLAEQSVPPNQVVVVGPDDAEIRAIMDAADEMGVSGLEIHRPGHVAALNARRRSVRSHSLPLNARTRPCTRFAVDHYTLPRLERHDDRSPAIWRDWPMRCITRRSRFSGSCRLAGRGCGCARRCFGVFPVLLPWLRCLVVRALTGAYSDRFAGIATWRPAGWRA